MRGLGLHHVLEKLEKIQREVTTAKTLVKKILQEGETPLEEATKVSNAQATVAIYCEEFKARYGANPVLGGKEIGLLTRLAKEHGVEKTSDLIKAYFKMSDAFYIKKRHDPATLFANLQAVGHYLSKAKMITSADASHMERAGQYQDLARQVDSGEL